MPRQFPTPPALPATRYPLHQAPQPLQRIRLLRPLVLPPAQHPREPHRDARFVARRRLDPLEAELEDLLGLHRAHRPELLDRVAAVPGVYIPDLGVGEPRVRLRARHPLARV